MEKYQSFVVKNWIFQLEIKHIFTTKPNTKKPLLKCLHINVKEQHCGLNKVCFYVHNLTSDIVNIKYTIFMDTHCAFSTNNAISLTLFPSPSTTRGSQFLFLNINWFFWQTFVCFICFFVFTRCFCLNVFYSLVV